MMREKIIAYLKNIIPEDIGITVSVPEREEQGHYATNVAFRLAPLRNERQGTSDKRQGISPYNIAVEIADILRKNSSDFFEKVEVAGGGFINFWIAQKVLRGELVRIATGDKQSETRDKRRMARIQVEFVSANPTGPLTLANGRGGFLGDVLSNVFETIGYKVEREYYVNDTGNQIAVLGKSIIVSLGLNMGQLSAEEKENLYQGDYIKDWAQAHKNVVKKYQTDPLKLGQRAAKDFLKSIKKVLEKKAKIKFDRWTSEEKDIHKKKLVAKVLDVFKKRCFVYEKDGATWLKTTTFNDDKDRVLVTSDGRPTYFLADGGHYFQTFGRGFKRKINILGPDHYGYVKRIQAVAKILGFEKSDVIITQALRLVENGKEVKMSKRKGQFVTFEELIDEVGIDAARFFFLMVSYDSHMDFDMALAKERSNKNPVYYVQYAYVRASSILKRVNCKIAKLQGCKIDFLNTNEDIKLMRELVKFSEVIEDTANDYQVHRLTRYATELARAFHNFYEKERIIEVASDKRQEASISEVGIARLVLVQATEIIFKKLFGILGISAPKQM